MNFKTNFKTEEDLINAIKLLKNDIKMRSVDKSEQ